MANDFSSDIDRWEYDTREDAEQNLVQSGFVPLGSIWVRRDELMDLHLQKDGSYAITRVLTQEEIERLDQRWGRHNLEAEHLTYVRALQEADKERLLAAGVSASDIIHHRMVGTARIRTDGQLWESDEAGKQAFITPVRIHPAAAAWDIESPDPQRVARNGEILDLVAWHPSRPNSFALRRGDAMVLGSHERRLSDEDPGILRVHRGPLEWLKSGVDGIVLMTRDEAEQRRLLLGVERIRADDWKHAEELRRVMRSYQATPVIDHHAVERHELSARQSMRVRLRA